MGEVSRDDLQGAIFADDFDYNEFVALITKHIEIQIPDNFSVLVKTEQADGSMQPFTEADNVVRQELLDHVYDAIIELDKKEEPVKPIDPVPTSIGNPGGTKETVLMEPEENIATDVSDSDKIDVVDDHFVGETVIPTPGVGIDNPIFDEKEPEIKIDLNLGSNGPARENSDLVNETAPVANEPEVEEHIGVEVPMKEELQPDVSAPVTSASAPSSSNPAYADRKSHIIALVKESKWTLKQITQIIDDQWGYAARGKSSKTRVSKTIRDLRDNQLLYEESNGILTWKGEG